MNISSPVSGYRPLEALRACLEGPFGPQCNPLYLYIHISRGRNNLTSSHFLRVKETSYEKSEDILRKDNLKSFQNIETDFPYLILVRFYSLKRKHHFWPENDVFWPIFELFRPLSVTGSGF